MPILEKENAPYAVCQAAVWIVTDNADYGRLGTLVSRRGDGFQGKRLINAYETVYAMKICDKAGINIKLKSIWSDRSSIYMSLKDVDLKKWLEETGVNRKLEKKGNAKGNPQKGKGEIPGISEGH